MQGPAPPLACPPVQAGFPTDEACYLSRTDLRADGSQDGRPSDKKQYIRIERAIVKNETRPAHGPDTVVVIKILDLEKTNPSSSDTLGLKHQALHAHRLAFDHPVTGERIELTSPLPDEFQHALDQLRAGRGSNS